MTRTTIPPRTETPARDLPGGGMGNARGDPHWLLSYRRKDLLPDFVAGTITATMLVPQAMAYSILAGVPVELGLYSSVLPLLAYAFLGTSRTLAIGPVAMISLLIGGGIGPLAGDDPMRAAQLAVQLALMVGLLQLLMAVFRAGFLVNFLSHPVLSGFTSAAAVVIAVSQLQHLIGITVPRGGAPWELFRDIVRGAKDLRLSALSFGGGTVALLVLWPRFARAALPRLGAPPGAIGPASKIGPLIAVVVGIIVSLRLDDPTLPIVGTIPGGLPSLALPVLHTPAIRRLLPTALVIAFVAFIESIAVAQVLAAKRRERILANRDLVALGAANLASAVSGGFPVAGGFGRSAVNFQSGARTGLAAIVTAGLVACTLVLLTPTLHHLPRAILGAIILVAVSTLIDIRAFLRTFRYSKRDAWCWLTTFGGVLWLGIEDGLIVGAALAIVFFLHRAARPHLFVAGRAEEGEPEGASHEPLPAAPPDVLSVRIEGSLFFGNVRPFEDLVLESIAPDSNIRHVLLIGRGIDFIDATALTSLELCRSRLEEAGVTLDLAELDPRVAERLRRVGFLAELGEEHYFESAREALLALSRGSDAVETPSRAPTD